MDNNNEMVVATSVARKINNFSIESLLSDRKPSASTSSASTVAAAVVNSEFERNLMSADGEDSEEYANRIASRCGSDGNVLYVIS